jgi:hypothetical protein
MDIWLICGKCRYRIKQLSPNDSRMNVSISVESLKCNCFQCGESNWLLIDARIRNEQTHVVEAVSSERRMNQWEENPTLARPRINA